MGTIDEKNMLEEIKAVIKEFRILYQNLYNISHLSNLAKQFRPLMKMNEDIKEIKENSQKQKDPPLKSDRC